MKNLKNAALLCKQAYKSGIPKTLKIENKKTSMVAFLKREKNANWLVFRGTDSLKDWAYNANFLPVRVQGSWIHCGFWLAHRSIWKEIRKELDPQKKLIVTGHSLGGALAEISILYLMRKGFKNVDLITFGKPNVFAKWQRGKQARLNGEGFKVQLSVVNGSDVVARIPRIGYRAALNQTQLWFAENEDFVDPTPEMKKDQWEMFSSVSSHDMSKYCERVDDFLESGFLVATLTSSLRE